MGNNKRRSSKKNSKNNSERNSRGKDKHEYNAGTSPQIEGEILANQVEEQIQDTRPSDNAPTKGYAPGEDEELDALALEMEEAMMEEDHPQKEQPLASGVDPKPPIQSTFDFSAPFSRTFDFSAPFSPPSDSPGMRPPSSTLNSPEAGTSPHKFGHAGMGLSTATPILNKPILPVRRSSQSTLQLAKAKMEDMKNSSETTSGDSCMAGLTPEAPGSWEEKAAEIEFTFASKFNQQEADKKVDTEKISQLEADNEVYRRKISQLEADGEADGGKVRQLEADKRVDREKVAELEDELYEAKDTHDSYVKTINRRRQEEAKKHKMEVEGLKKQIDVLTHEKLVTEHEQEKLKEKNDAYEQKREKREKDFVNAECQLSEMQEVLKEKDEDVQKLKGKFNALEKDHRRLKDFANAITADFEAVKRGSKDAKEVIKIHFGVELDEFDESSKEKALREELEEVKARMKKAWDERVDVSTQTELVDGADMSTQTEAVGEATASTQTNSALGPNISPQPDSGEGINISTQTDFGVGRQNHSPHSPEESEPRMKDASVQTDTWETSVTVVINPKPAGFVGIAFSEWLFLLLFLLLGMFWFGISNPKEDIYLGVGSKWGIYGVEY